MTTQRQSQLFDLRTDREKMRRLFQRFGKAQGEEKKLVAQELMDRLNEARPAS